MSENSKDLSENEVKKNKRIYIINAIIYLLYSVLIYGLYFVAMPNSGVGEVVAGLLTIYTTVAHSVVNLIIAIIRKVQKKKDVLAFALSFLFILLLGNGVCFSVLALRSL
ncbi:MAG: hypothetical protein ABUK01_01055 [Leptospirales bacterium]